MFVNLKINVTQKSSMMLMVLLSGSSSVEEQVPYPVALCSSVVAFTSWDWPWDVHFFCFQVIVAAGEDSLIK